MRSKTETIISTNIHPRLSAADLAPGFESHPKSSEKQEQELTAYSPLINADPKQKQDNGLV
jgi:hypothetical protein